MPELPEVETLRSQLASVLVDATIETLEVLDPKIGILPDLRGVKITAVKRRGKGIEILLDDSRSLNIHLRMTGRLQWLPKIGNVPERSRLVINVDRGRVALVDLRRFATVTVTDNQSGEESKEQDIFSNIAASSLLERAAGKKIPVKAFLLDQAIIPGMGNIYACEVLHQAGINPGRPASSVTSSEWEKIISHARATLRKSIDCRGTSVSDWLDLFGEKGEFQNHLHVYSREGLACLRCGQKVERIKIGGRGTYFCPGCQC